MSVLRDFPNRGYPSRRYNENWTAYARKAQGVLDIMRDQNSDAQRDGEWVKISRLYNVGVKLIAYMIDKNMIERRHESTLDCDWFRIALPVYGDDFGDLWIA